MDRERDRKRRGRTANPCSDHIDNDVNNTKEQRWHQTLEDLFPAMPPSFLPKTGDSDYSIAIPYAGPHPAYEVPRAQPSKDDTAPNRRKKKNKNKNKEEEEEEHIRRPEPPESVDSATLANGPPESADSTRIGRHRPIHKNPPELTVSTRIGRLRRNQLVIPTESADSTKIGTPRQNRQAPPESTDSARVGGLRQKRLVPPELADSARIGGLDQSQQVLPELADSAKNGTSCQNCQDFPESADSVRIGGMHQKRLALPELADSARIGGLDQNWQVPPESADSESCLLHSSSFSFPLTLAEPLTMAETDKHNNKVGMLNHDINPDFTFPQHNINGYDHKHEEEPIISMVASTEVFNGNGIFSIEKMETQNIPNGNRISSMKKMEILNGNGISSMQKTEIWNGNGIYSIQKTENRNGNGTYSMQEMEIRNGNGIFSIQKTEILNGNGSSLVQRTEIFNGIDGNSSTHKTEILNGSNGIFLKQKLRRGKCHLCFKGHILQETETCLVCCAKYCIACVLQAMGSMPEGRKCETCIEKPIDERKRGCLGKPSRLLSRILGPLEIQLIMQAEKQCPANRLRPEQIVVNGRPLKPENLTQLLTCNKPPLGLKPGRYWYDKQAGLWGKEGEKPDRIIEADLDDVGGELQDDASNGNTRVYINERQIRKRELRMLKYAGVQCPPGTRLWVEANGNYKLEGIKNVIGNIWDKKTIRFLYQICSLPVPQQKNSGRSKEDAIVKLSQTVPEYLQQKKVHKLLLLGFQGSGTSTIFKQAKFLYANEQAFTKDELQEFKLMIQCNIYKYISILLEACERFEEEEDERRVTDPDVPNSIGDVKRKNIYSVEGRLKKKSDWFLEVMANGDLETYFPASTREYAPLVEELWRDPAIQAAYNRRDELHTLPSVTKYFLEQAVDVSSYGYEPSETDIIYTEGLSQASSLAELEFTLNETSSVSDENYDTSPTLFRLVRVSSKVMNDGCKWLDMFEDVKVVIFCVALSDYDQMWRDGSNSPRNKMMASRDLFECIASYPSFRDMPFVLILNKYDILEEKIQEFPLTTCDWFSDFDPVRTSNYTPTTLAQQAYTYIAHKFKKLFECVNNTGRKLYTFQMKARDRSSVALAFYYVQEIVNWEDYKGVIVDDITDESISTDTGSVLQVKSSS